MSTRIFPLISLLVLLAALGPGCRQRPAPPPISPEGQGGDPAQASAEGQEIGDVETSLRYEILLSPESIADNIISDEKMSSLEYVMLATIHVGAPRPKSLWLNAIVRSKHNFPGHTVLIRPRMYLSGEDGFKRISIPMDDIIMGNTAIWDVNIRRIDLMKYLDEIPKTLLVTGKLEIYYFQNTALADADLENLDSFPADMRAQRQANPTRVNFNF